MRLDVAQRFAEDALDRHPVVAQSVASSLIDLHGDLGAGAFREVGQHPFEVRRQLQLVGHPQAGDGIARTRQAADRRLFGRRKTIGDAGGVGRQKVPHQPDLGQKRHDRMHQRVVQVARQAKARPRQRGKAHFGARRLELLLDQAPGAPLASEQDFDLAGSEIGHRNHEVVRQLPVPQHDRRHRMIQSKRCTTHARQGDDVAVSFGQGGQFGFHSREQQALAAVGIDLRKPRDQASDFPLHRPVGSDDGKPDDVGFCSRKQLRAEVDHSLSQPHSTYSGVCRSRPQTNMTFVMFDCDFRQMSPRREMRSLLREEPQWARPWRVTCQPLKRTVCTWHRLFDAWPPSAASRAGSARPATGIGDDLVRGDP